MVNSKFDIRGASWRRRNLYRANFNSSYAGVSKHYKLFQLLEVFILGIVTGGLSAITSIWATEMLSSINVAEFSLLPGLIIITPVLTVLLVVRKCGFAVTLGLGSIYIIAIGFLASFIQEPFNAALFYVVLTVIQEFIVLYLAGISVAFIKSISRIAFICLALISLIGVTSILLLFKSSHVEAQIDIFDAVITACILFTGGFIGWDSFKINNKFSGIKQQAISLASIGGTTFQGANLAEADFSQSILKHTDFRDANLTRTYWKGAQDLEYARLDNTYLINPKIQQLVVSCDGQDHSFDGLDLTGVNLRGANLQDASFIGASLNQSDLSGANLSRAILKQTQLDGADLTGAILTGACIEDWGITNTTKLDNVQCDYVFMHVATKDNPNRLRKPDNWRENFADGEFADFIQPFFDTLDLYHSQDVDPRAISIALKSLADAHPDDDLQLVAMERRGKNGLNLRFTTAPKANKSELSHEYFANYAQIKKELPVAVQMRIAEQDAEIRTLKGTIEQFILTGTHQSNIQANTIQVIQGELVMTENKGINISAGDNANISGLSSGDGVVNLGTISGNVTNSINQLPDSPEANEPDLKSLLTQLQQIIEADTDLPEPDKADLLEQVQSLAEAKQVEEPVKRESIARKAMKIFDATLKSLPDTARIVEACSKLLPLVLTALGLAV